MSGPGHQGACGGHPELVSGVRAGPRPWHCQATNAQGSWMGPSRPCSYSPAPVRQPAPLRHRDRSQGPGRGHRAGGSESRGVRELRGQRAGGGAGEDGHLHERPRPLSGYEEGQERCGDALPSCGGHRRQDANMSTMAWSSLLLTPGCSLHR